MCSPDPACSGITLRGAFNRRSTQKSAVAVAHRYASVRDAAGLATPLQTSKHARNSGNQNPRNAIDGCRFASCASDNLHVERVEHGVSRCRSCAPNETWTATPLHVLCAAGHVLHIALFTSVVRPFVMQTAVVTPPAQTNRSRLLYYYYHYCYYYYYYYYY